MKLFSKFKNFFNVKKLKKIYKSSVNVIKKRPITSFSVSLALLFLIILIGSIISAPQETQIFETPVKSVEIYKIGDSPRLTVQAKIEKTGVITITALTGGVVNSINVVEGQNVIKNANLITLSSNYQGGNTLEISLQIAQAQYQNILNTFQNQIDLIQKQKDLANKVEENTNELREIQQESTNETQNFIDLNQNILDTVNSNLDNYVATNSAGVNNALILQTRQLKSQLQSALNGLRQSFRNIEYQSSDEEPPAQIARTQKDIALEQLDLQKKSLELNKEISRLQVVIAGINAATMHPTAPFAGRIEKIYVKIGMAVSPGTPLLMISGNKGETNAIALVTENIARNVSVMDESILYLNGKSYSAKPFYVSTEATNGQVYSVYFSLPADFNKITTDGSYITVNIPIGLPDTGAAIPFVPIDAIYQSQDQAYLFVVQDNKAVSKNIALGQVYGRFVEVKSGLESGDQVILNRNIIANDLIDPIY